MTEQTTNEPARLTGAFELFGKGYEIIKKNFEVFMILFSVSGIFAVWEALGSTSGPKETEGGWGIVGNGIFGPDVSINGAVAVLITVLMLLYVVSYMMLTVAVVRAAQGKKLQLGAVWKELTQKWLWLKMIGTFLILVITIFAGFILLIVPGIILLWRLFLVPYALVERKNIKEAFKTSWEISRGRFGAVYAIILVSILLSLPSFVPVIGPIAAFLLTSIYMVAPALRYEELKKLT
jgi:hypothetical protein